MPPINRTMTAAEWTMLVVLAVLWGGSYFYVGVAVKALPPFAIVAFRVTAGAALLYLVVRLYRERMPRDSATWRAFVVMGLMNNVIPFSLIAWAQGQVPSGLAAILNATTPLFGVVFAHYLVRDERMTPGRAIGLVVGFSGVVVMIGAGALAGAATNLLTDAALLAASAFYALSPLWGRRLGIATLPPMVAATGQFAAAALVLVPLTVIVDRPWTLPMPSAGVWASLAGLAVFSTALGYILYYRILATAGAVNLLLVTFLVPVTGILLGALFLGERLGLNHYLGMAIIGLGLAAIDGRLLRRLQVRPVR